MAGGLAAAEQSNFKLPPSFTWSDWSDRSTDGLSERIKRKKKERQENKNKNKLLVLIEQVLI